MASWKIPQCVRSFSLETSMYSGFLWIFPCHVRYRRLSLQWRCGKLTIGPLENWGYRGYPVSGQAHGSMAPTPDKPHWSLNPEHFGWLNGWLMGLNSQNQWGKINGWLNPSSNPKINGWLNSHIKILEANWFHFPLLHSPRHWLNMGSSPPIVRWSRQAPFHPSGEKIWPEKGVKSRGFYHVPYSYLSYCYFVRVCPNFRIVIVSWTKMVSPQLLKPRVLMFPGWFILHGWFCWCDFWFGSHRGREFHVFGLVLHWNFMVHHGPSWSIGHAKWRNLGRIQTSTCSINESFAAQKDPGYPRIQKATKKNML